jgi:hypothetical protein
MSLQLAAQHLSDQGRGPDTTLVHMSNKEVKSLNDLAMAHGGQLTINPQTGLPEAGFLSSILPMVAGMALNAYAPGLGSVASGALVGGASYLMNPKAGLMGGLMAGMGAYGGANLGEALAAQGMEQAAGKTIAEQAGKNITEMGSNLSPEGFVKAGVQPGQYGYGLSGEMAGADMPSALSNAQYGAGTNMANIPKPTNFMGRIDAMGQGASSLGQTGGLSGLTDKLGGASGVLKTGLAAAAPIATMQTPPAAAATGDKDMGQRYTFSANKATPLPAPDVPTYQTMATQPSNFGAEQQYFVRPEFKAVTGEEAKNIYGFAGGGPVEQMSNDNAIGANTGFPQAYLHNNAYATPYQTPVSQNVLTGAGDVAVDPYTGEQKMAEGGISDAGYNLGGYSDGGRLLRGPGDGVSDSIPAMIGKKQPARLADGEFVVPARIVSELGNGSTEAGARKLYAMLDRVQSARSKSIGKGKVAKNSRADKYLPA